MKLNPVLIAALGLLSIAMFASGAAITRTSGAQLITIPEDSTEASTTLTCPGFTLLPSLDGKTAVFLDPDGSVSDFVLLANLNGGVSLPFVPIWTGPPLAPPPPILQPEVTEPTPFIAVATSPTGSQLRFTFTSDANEAAGVPSETIQVAPIAEPASLTLAGLGGLLLICGFFLRRRSF